MKRRSVILPSLVAVPLFIGYFFYPLESDNFSIKQDPESYNGKLEYLDRKVESLPDSLMPNILWILVDDLSIADTDLYEKGPVEVPQMNKLANEGVKFTNAYISSPVCSPSRASIVTGRYNQRFGFEHQLHERYLRNRMEYYGFKYIVDAGPWEPQYQTEVPNQEFVRNIGMPKSEIMLSEILKNYDYRTGYVGKWHVGKTDENSPNKFGFDHFYGFYSSHTLYSYEGTPGIVDQKIPDDFTEDYIWGGQRDDIQAIRVNGKVIKEDRYLTKAITDESIKFIGDKKDEPFYVVASYNAPHTPLQAPEEYVQMYENEPDPVKRVHYAMIKCLDDEIGRLLKYLEDEELADNTLVMLISDNGGAEYTYTTHNGKYQGGKITNFEGGVKVPMIMRWPDRVSEGMVFDHPVHATDLYYTSAKALNISLPDDRIYDGADLVKHVSENTVPHEYIYFEMGKNRGIRSLEWKLTWNEDNNDTLLFDLRKDQYEQKNIYGTNPEVVQALTDAFFEWSDHNMEPLWPGMINYHYTGDDGRDYYFDE